VATDASKETSSLFGDVDLLDEEAKTENKPEPKKESPKGDGSDGGSSSAGSDSDSSSDSSDSDGSDSDSDLSEGSSSGSNESTSSSSAGGGKTDVTPKHRNFMTPLKRAVKSPGGKNSERKMPVSTSVPPPSTFKHTKRFALKNPMVPRRGGGGKHQRLATDEGEAEDKERHSNDLGREFKVHDPANFPLEQFTDAEYGRSGSPPENYSYASADPNNFDYEPRPLMKMDAVDNRAHDEKWQGKIIAYGFCCTIIVCLFIMIASIVAYNSHMNVRPAPKNLAEVCSLQSIGTSKGYKRCKKSCKEAACCMASHGSSCFLEQQEVCMEYSPCATIHTNYDDSTSDFNLVVPPAPLDLEKICADSNVAIQTGFLDCQAACNPGLCCLPTTVSDPTDNVPDIKACWATHEDVCQHYTPCKALEGVAENHGSPVDLANLKCSVHNLKFAEGVEDCGNICQTRSCCFADSKKMNCREDNEVWCNEFAACEHLLTAPDFGSGTTDTSTSESDNVSTGGSAPTSMQETCTDIASLDDTTQYTCTQICQPATCCFYNDADCEKHIDCQFYSFCENVTNFLGGGGGSGPNIDHHSSSPSDVQIACNDISTPSGLDQCYFHCSDYRCCFKDDFDPISCHARGICNQYDPCEKLEGINDTHSKSTIDDLCSVPNLLIGGGFDQCENVCAGKLCCFDESPGGCSTRPNCVDYEACSILMGSFLLGKDASGGAIFDVNQICSTESIGDPEIEEMCETVCEKHSCCLNSSCSDGTDCSKFTACNNLPSNKPPGSYPIPTVNMAATCNIHLMNGQGDPFYEQNCVNLCQPAECCRDDTCRQVNDFCEHYTACYAVWDGDDSSNLSEACVDESAIGKAACLKACENWECCWAENNCFAANNAKCIEAVEYCLSDTLS